jgi:hypothetical protein
MITAKLTKMETDMKKVLNRFASVRMALLVIATGCAAVEVSVAQASSPPTTSYFWQFATSANPASPDTATGGVGTAAASITPGLFSDGWLSNNAAVFGNANGIWNLGQNGEIVVSDDAGLTGTGSPAASISVQVVQYIDGGIYSSHAVVTIPGAVAVSTNSSVAPGLTAGPIGGWIVDETIWSVEAGTPITSIAIASAVPNGSVIDSVSVQATSGSGGSAPSPVLTIQGPVGGNVTISWSANFSNMVLESNSELTNSQGWSTVQASAQVNGNTVSVTVPAGSGTQFYRLKQP